MLLFGYIVSETKQNSLPEDIIKVVQNENECEMQLPKLIVGLSLSKRYAKEHNFDFDILNHTFPNGDMWTFKKTEKREIYEENVIEFKNYIINNIANSINYYYINMYNLKYKDIRRLYGILFNNSLNRYINYILIDKNMVYYPLKNNNVMGISLSHLNYIGLNKDKIIEKLRQGVNNRVYFSTHKKLWKLKDWFNGIEYVIPSLLTNNAIK